jgi:SNF2 family DNA or RNA helicase
MIIADELSKLKSYRTSQGGVRAKALSKVAHSMTERFVGLTGTPSPNGLQDLWGSTWFIDKGMRLGATFTAYKNRWFRSHPSGYGLQPVEWAEDEIHNLISDIYIAVDHKLNVDEPLTNIIAVDLPASARTTYRELEKLLFTEIGEHKIDVISGAAKAQKLLQVASGAVIHDTESRDWVEIHDVKMQALESVLSEANGMPVLVAYHYKSTMERLLKHFPQGRKFDTNPATERDWNAGLIPLMFIHPASGGHGSNLQDGGNIMVFIDHDWNLENYLQVIERIGPVRQKQAGHNRPVFLHYIVAKNTMDEVVLSRRKSKKTVQDSLLDAIKTRSIGRDYDYEL